MSIINLEKTFENEQLVYCNLDNKIIECTCLSKLYKYSVEDYNNEYIGSYFCDKVKVITIYDIYKNIIYKPIQTNLFKDPIEIDTILKNLIGNIYFFKIFTGAFIKCNILNDIKYHTNYIGFISKILYKNISLEIHNYIKIFNIYDNERKRIHKIKYEKDFLIYYKNYNDGIKYIINDNYIKIRKGKFPFYKTIYYNAKNLKIYRYYKNLEDIREERNDNNEITYLIKYYDLYKRKDEFISNDINPPFSKPLRKIYIELINNYNKNINNYNELIKSCFKKEKIVHNNLLLECKLEIINSI